MRVAKDNAGLRVKAIAGSYVVLLGWNMDAAQIRNENILGFAISRKRHEDGEIIWLPGMKTFASANANPDQGTLVSSFYHPFQTFQWADYTPAPEKKTYTYTVVARKGAPTQLASAASVSLEVTTERVDHGKHAVFFNRGAVASQEYARRFLNKRPEEWGQEAFDWLSRGLLESLERFIGQAGAGDALLGAFFEFKNKRVYTALKAAKARGAMIKILYDADSQGQENEDALAHSGITGLTQAREHSGSFAHNKFLILRRAGVSQEVWTGSTNLSQNGVFGHSNNAHLVRDAELAEAYYRYWSILAEDETLAPTAAAVAGLGDVPPAQGKETSAVFSPRPDLASLEWYAALASEPKPLFATFAFGMNKRFVSIYEQADNVLRFALMEKKGNGKAYKEQAAAIDRLRKLPNVVVSVGNRVALNNFDRWLEEIDRIVNEVHVLYIHTKYMLIDPLGNDPIVIVGSANFSEASANRNDENMLVIRGNTAVADIYIGEFMRLFSHYAFRESLKFKPANTTNLTSRKHLVESPQWIEGEKPWQGYFEPGTDRALRRQYFSA